MMHIKEPLLLIGKRTPCSVSRRFPLSLSEWFFVIGLTPYTSKLNISFLLHRAGVSLNIHSFIHSFLLQISNYSVFQIIRRFNSDGSYDLKEVIISIVEMDFGDKGMIHLAIY